MHQSGVLSRSLNVVRVPSRHQLSCHTTVDAIQVSARTGTCFTVSIFSTAQSPWSNPGQSIQCHPVPIPMVIHGSAVLLTACLRKLHGLCQPPLPCTRQATANSQRRLRSTQPRCRNNVGYALARFQSLPQERRAHEGVLRQPFHKVCAWLRVGTETQLVSEAKVSSTASSPKDP